ncbi:hypothetical protein J1N35_008706, partial [Gossypium stocksii]
MARKCLLDTKLNYPCMLLATQLYSQCVDEASSSEEVEDIYFYGAIVFEIEPTNEWR